MESILEVLTTRKSGREVHLSNAFWSKTHVPLVPLFNALLLQCHSRRNLSAEAFSNPAFTQSYYKLQIYDVASSMTRPMAYDGW